VALHPPDSPFADAVREAAKLCKVDVVSIDAATPADLASRVLVADLTRVMATRGLGPRAIAISDNTKLDCFDVIRPDDVGHRLTRSLSNLVHTAALEASVKQKDQTVRLLNEIGLALSHITERDALLREILTRSMEVLSADGGTVYMVERGRLVFASAANDTVRFATPRVTLPIDDSSLAGFVANNNELLNIEDVYRLPRSVPYRPNLRFDEQSGYRTKSMLVAPMADRDGRVIGVLALVNRKPVPKVPLADFDRVLAFTDLQANLVASIASQAAVALENHRLYADIRQLFDGFITAAVSVIEARDPSTAGHSQRVSDLTVALARACQDCTEGPFNRIRFSSEELEELRYASLLHDFGKVGVKEEILLKANKLFPHELEKIEWRFRIAGMQAMLESMSLEMVEYPLGTKLQQLDADLQLIRRLNQSGYRYSTREADALKRIAERWFLEEDQQPVVPPQVINRLCIPGGSLDPEERLEIQRHVEHTYNFLKVIPWTENLRRVPEIAFAHHEKLDGSGYPLGLIDDEIPFGAKLMTISDIFDALTAGDRPYKSGMGPRRALFILREEAGRGRLDSDAVELFAAKKIWASVMY